MSTSAYFGKEAALTCIKALAAVGVVFPMAWLPVEWSSAAFLGLIGGSLQVMVVQDNFMLKNITDIN